MLDRRSNGPGSGETADGLWDSVQEQMGGRPFGDVFSTREIVWSALGVEWHVGFENDYATATGAEEFCALAQVIQADLVDIDLCLLPTTVRVAVRLENRASLQLNPVPSNEDRLWALRLPSDPAPAEGVGYETELMAVVFEILREASVASSTEFDAAVERVLPASTRSVEPTRG